MSYHLITLTIIIPFLGAIAQAFAPRQAHRWIALGASLAASFFGIVQVLALRTQVPELQAVESFPWIESYAIRYDMGLDGLNALLLLLLSIVFPLLITAEWNLKRGVQGMHGLLLVLHASLIGAVCSQDLFLMLFFWTLSALPFYFLIGIWGGPRRESAAVRAIVTASLGNALLFAALVLIYHSVEPHTFSIGALMSGKLEGKSFPFLGQELSVSHAALTLVALGIALRIPVWPLNGWFTRVAEEAPTSVLVALSAATVPVGCYLFIRLAYSLFPETVGDFAPIIVAVGAVNLVIGGLCAVAQRGLRLLLAFICVGEVGLILMGVGSLSSPGVVGAVYQVMALGLGLGGLGLLAGILVDRTGDAFYREESGAARMGGIASRAPFMALVAGVVVASLLGFPGLTGFVGHSLLVIGSYAIYPGVMILAAGALLLAAAYLFNMYRYVFLGEAKPAVAAIADLTLREKAYFLPLVLAILMFGVYPRPLIELIRPTVLTLLSTIK